jgi:hypothetical protein
MNHTVHMVRGVLAATGVTISDGLRACLPNMTTLLIVTSAAAGLGEDHIRTYEGDRPMAKAWTNDELDRVGAAEELVIASVPGDPPPTGSAPRGQVDAAYHSKYGLPHCLKGVGGGAPIATEIVQAVTRPQASSTTTLLAPR